MVDSISSFDSGSSASGINFSGLASGLDTSAIIAALTRLEERPIEAAKQKQTKTQNLITLSQQLNTKFKTLRDKAAALTTIAQGLSFSTTSSDNSRITASASSGASAGPHTIEVSQLAKAASSYGTAASTITDPAAATTNTGNLTITYAGTGKTIDVSGKSLNEVRDLINDQVTGVTASVVNIGTSSNPNHRLVITGDETGSTKGLSFTVDAGVDLSFTTISSAQNAIFSVDGIPNIERETNTVGDYLDGVTLTFLNTTETNKPITLTVSTDVSAIKGKIKGFVDAMNDIASFYNTQNTYNAATKIAGAFFGDNSIRSLVSRMRDLAFGNGESNFQSNEEYASLSAVGITVQGDGTFKLDDAKLTEKLGKDATKVLDLFADSDGAGTDAGLAVVLRQFAQDASTGGKNADGTEYAGALDSRIATLEDRVTSLQRTIDDGEDRLAKYTKQLKAKYARYEQTIGQLKAQQSALFAKFGGGQ